MSEKYIKHELQQQVVEAGVSFSQLVHELTETKYLGLSQKASWWLFYIRATLCTAKHRLMICIGASVFSFFFRFVPTFLKCRLGKILSWSESTLNTFWLPPEGLNLFSDGFQKSVGSVKSKKHWFRYKYVPGIISLLFIKDVLGYFIVLDQHVLELEYFWAESYGNSYKIDE